MTLNKSSKSNLKPEPKLTKVTMEFDDGKVQWLEGDQADKWLYAVNGQCVISHVHGMSFPKFEWKVKKCPSTTK